MKAQNSQSHDCFNVTRRNFLTAAVLGVTGIAGAAFAPKIASASEVADGIAQNAQAQGEEAMRCWEKAVEEATAAGEPIYENITPLPSKIVPYAYMTGSVSKWINVGLVPTQVGAIAVYETTSASRISTVYNAWIEVSYGSVSNQTYSWTHLDGGRTIAVNYSCSISNVVGINEVWTFYAEFGVSGGTWMA